ncbi:MAG: hypothetical protein HXS48_00020 [Theionarchaea archaeon]|nr:hypothetical protein [Theionarchaea archaeon]
MTQKSKILDKLSTALFAVVCTFLGNWIYDYLKKENPPFIDIITRICHSISSNWSWVLTIIFILFFVIISIFFFEEISRYLKKHDEVVLFIIWISIIITGGLAMYEIGIAEYLMEYRFHISIPILLLNTLYWINKYNRNRRYEKKYLFQLILFVACLIFILLDFIFNK